MKRLILPVSALLISATGIQQAAAQAPTTFNMGITNFVYVGKSGFNASSDTTAIYTTPDPSTPPVGDL